MPRSKSFNSYALQNTTVEHVMNDDEIVGVRNRQRSFENNEFTKQRPPPIRSVSQHIISRDSRAPAEGLKKLATSFRNTVKTNKMEIERYRNTFKDKNTQIDPRFRRERTKSPKKTMIHTHSDSIVIPQRQERKTSQSTPTFVCNTKQEKKTSKIPAPATQSNVERPVSEKGTSTINFEATAESQTMETALNCGSVVNQSKNAACNTDHEQIQLEYTHCNELSLSNQKKLAKDSQCNINNETDTNSKSLTMTTTESEDKPNYVAQYEEVSGNCMKMNYLQRSLCWEDPRLLKKYANVMTDSTLKKTRSSMTLPFVLPSITDDTCMCVRCAQRSRNSYVFDNVTDFDGNTGVFDASSYLKNQINLPYFMGIFYTFGCICGLSIVALIAWIVSNDYIWNMVHSKPELQKSFLSNCVTTVGGAIFFALNYVVSTFYAFFVLPRSAVFGNEVVDGITWNFL